MFEITKSNLSLNATKDQNLWAGPICRGAAAENVWHSECQLPIRKFQGVQQLFRNQMGMSNTGRSRPFTPLTVQLPPHSAGFCLAVE
jgi:hypothetical protein